MATVIPIDDPKDPRIAAYREVRERDLVGRQGLFIAEGEVVIGRFLASSRHQPLSLLLDAKRVASFAALDRLSPDIPVYAASRTVLDAIAGFPLHRGMLALGRAVAGPGVAAMLAGAGRRRFVVAAIGIANHDNMGGIFRNAAAFGAAGIILDRDCCDPLYRKAIRVSVGTALTLPFARLADGEGLLARLAEAGFTALALSPNGSLDLSDLKAPDRTAILLGAEGPGLPPGLLAGAVTVRIPMAEGVDSLNVATSSGIVLHHIAAAHRRR